MIILGEESMEAADTHNSPLNSPSAAKSNATLDILYQINFLCTQQHTQSRTTREVDRNERDFLVIS
jgi:hypothetical protein